MNALLEMQAIRRANLRKLKGERGGFARLADLLGKPTYIGFLTSLAGPNPSRNITEQFSRKTEFALRLYRGWFDDPDAIVPAHLLGDDGELIHPQDFVQVGPASIPSISHVEQPPSRTYYTFPEKAEEKRTEPAVNTKSVNDVLQLVVEAAKKQQIDVPLSKIVDVVALIVATSTRTIFRAS